MKKILIFLMLSTITIIASPFKYLVPADKTVVELSIFFAESQVGVYETKSNWKPKIIQEYLKSVDIYFPAPYCMAGQYWTFKKACDSLNLDYSYIPILKTGSTGKLWNWVINKRNGFDKAVYEAEVGDLIIWWASGNGHIERVDSVFKAGWVRTVGFNTSSGSYGSQSNGGGVYNRKRNILSPLERMKIKGLIGYKN